MADVVLNPKTSALLLQDLQNELIKGSRPVVPLSGAALIANCQKLLAKARAVGMPVIHVRVARRPDLRDAPRPPLGTPSGAGGAPSLIEGSEGAAIVAELRTPALGEHPVAILPLHVGGQHRLAVDDQVVARAGLGQVPT